MKLEIVTREDLNQVLEQLDLPEYSGSLTSLLHSQIASYNPDLKPYLSLFVNGRKFPFLDCWGLVIEFYRRELGIELDDYTDFSIKDGYEKETSRNSFREIAADEAKFGDVIAFFRHGQIFHVGVKLTKGEMLHTGLNRHARVEKIKSMQFVESKFYHYAHHS